MTTLTTRLYVGEADLQPIADMLNACEAFDQSDDGHSINELRDEFTDPTLDPTRDLRLWSDADGTLVGFGQIWMPSSGDVIDGGLWFRVLPQARGGELETEIINWGTERMQEVRRQRNVEVKLRSWARNTDAERLALLEGQGFVTDRYFLRMARPLNEPIPEPLMPTGFTLRHSPTDDEVPAWVEMFNQSFIDHWNHHPMLVEAKQHWMHDAIYIPERDMFAVALDGTFAAFCSASIDPEENARTGRNEGWINLVGTRRGFRKIGLGRAMLLIGLQRLKADGMDTAILGVDADSLTGATRLYESVGFAPIRTFVNLIKDLE